MNPYKLAESLYDRDSALSSLDHDILLWSNDPKGVVISTDQFLVLISIPDDPSYYHIYLLAGYPRPAAEHLVKTLPWRPRVTYKRRGALKVQSTAKWLKRLELDEYAPKG